MLKKFLSTLLILTMTFSIITIIPSKQTTLVEARRTWPGRPGGPIDGSEFPPGLEKGQTYGKWHNWSSEVGYISDLKIPKILKDLDRLAGVVSEAAPQYKPFITAGQLLYNLAQDVHERWMNQIRKYPFAIRYSKSYYISGRCMKIVFSIYGHRMEELSTWEMYQGF